MQLHVFTDASLCFHITAAWFQIINEKVDQYNVQSTVWRLLE